jgi:hypothetical protein
MTYKLTVKPCDLAVKSPECLHIGRGASLDSIVSTLFADFDYELEMDIHELLDEHRAIADIWTAADVLHVRPDLDDDQAWHVLQVVQKRYDAQCGITWETLEYVADELYPLPGASGEEGVQP